MKTGDQLPPRWPWLFRLFRDYAPKYAAKHFHFVGIAKSMPAPSSWEGPALIVMNHPSWWDPIIGYVLCRFWPNRLDFAPIDATALEKYKFLAKAGLFGIDPGTLRGAREFLRVGRQLMTYANASLWVTAQGQFTDARIRPVELRAGVGHIAAGMSHGVILPIAVEYTFWNESKPVALIGCGSPIAAESLSGSGPKQCTSVVASALEKAMDALAAEAQSRDTTRFQPLVQSRAGVGGLYDFGRRARALLTGRRFRADHSE
ncbi:MAG: lysophospholipid acyltransferase family protein [Gemmataceae bacterium]|nr:lysophospholipid acyltransferase family protein [Gemmataceae bacterium]